MSHSKNITALLKRLGTAVLSTLALILGVMVLLAAVVPSVGLADGCANEAVRTEQGAASLALAECRAYELVSPPGNAVSYLSASPSGQFGASTGDTLASVSGDKVSYYSFAPDPGDPSDGSFFLSTRGVAGWSTVNVIPPQSTGAGEIPQCTPGVYFSADLSQNILGDGYREYAGHGARPACGTDEPALLAGEPEGGFHKLFLHDDETGSYQLVNITPAGVAAENAVLEDVSADFTHVLFGEVADLVPSAPGGMDLYEWAGGKVRLLTYLPDGAPVLGELADGSPGQLYEGHLQGSDVEDAAPVTHATSADGERVFFYADGNLYLRENVTQTPTSSGECSESEPDAACTVQVDTDQGGTGAGGGGVFFDASADGSRVFFMDQSRLTANSTAASGKPDLYEYDVEAPVGERLRDLTVDVGEPADVLGYSGASQDGSYLYFVAMGALTGSQENSHGAVASAKKPNLYVNHEGATTFVATLNASSDANAWATGSVTAQYLSTAVSPDGAFIAFNSIESLTGYDNRPVEPEECKVGAGLCREVFLYSAGENRLVCASCDPDGAPPTGPADIPSLAANIFGPTEPVYGTRDLFDDGRLFFNSPDALVPSDTNGFPDVYEYQAGQLHLISTGTAAGESVFDEASASGDDVFFVTPQALVGADIGETPSLYDARVDGGFPPAPGEKVEGESCGSEEACRPPLGEPPVEPFSASATLSGPGNLLTPPPKSEEPPARKPVAKRTLTRAQKLARALQACKRKPKHERGSCEAAARRKFGTKTNSKAKKSEKGGER